eukprot:1083181-Rhodomonas_salina.1
MYRQPSDSVGGEDIDGGIIAGILDQYGNNFSCPRSITVNLVCLSTTQCADFVVDASAPEASTVFAQYQPETTFAVLSQLYVKQSFWGNDASRRFQVRLTMPVNVDPTCPSIDRARDRLELKSTEFVVTGVRSIDIVDLQMTLSPGLNPANRLKVGASLGNLSAAVRDARGNLILQSQGTVNLTLISQTGSVSLSGRTTAKASGG